jgi:hypothetical protein
MPLIVRLPAPPNAGDKAGSRVLADAADFRLSRQRAPRARLTGDERLKINRPEQESTQTATSLCLALRRVSFHLRCIINR